MLVHRKKRQVYRMQALLTPLIDIVFMLLIFFMLTANFIAESAIDIDLPDSEATKPQAQEEIAVYIDGQGEIYVGRQPVKLNALQKRLQELLPGNSDSVVMIRADQSADLQTVVNVMDISRAAGAGRMSLATQKTGDRG